MTQGEEPGDSPPGPAPPSVLDDSGRPLFGTYTGRVPMVDYGGLASGNRPRLFTHKRWQYVSIAGSEVVLAVAVIDLGWAGSAFAYLFDRRTRRLLVDCDVVTRHGRARVTPRLEAPAETSIGSSRLYVRLQSVGTGRWRLSARSPGLTVDASLQETPAGPTLCALAPVAGGIVDCTHKTPALGVDGVASAGGTVFDLSGCHGSLDHTDGLLARTTRWRWASATDGRVSLNLTEDFTAPYENAAWIDGRIHRLAPVRFEFDDSDPGAAWRITSDGALGAGGDRARPGCGDVELEFTPEGRRQKHTSLVLASSRYVQPVGTFRGTVAGTSFDGLVGVTEDHAARW